MRFHRTYRLRLFINLFTAVAFATVLLVAAIFAWLRMQTVKDVEDIQLKTLHNLNSVFSSYLQGFDYSAREAYALRYSSVLLQEPKNNWVSFAMPCSEHFRTIMINNAYIRSIALFNQKGFIMNTQRETISDESQKQLLHTLLSGGNELILLNARHMVHGYPMPTISIVKGERDKNGAWSQGVVISVDVETLGKVLLEGCDDSLMIIDGGGRVIMSRDMSLFGREIAGESYISRILNSGQKEITFTEKKDRQNVLVCAVADTGGKYFIVNAQPQEELLSAQTAGYDILFRVATAVIVISLLISFGLSLKMAKPVSELVSGITQLTPETASDMKIDEFSMARAALIHTMQMVRSLKNSYLTRQQIHCLMGMETEQPEQSLFDMRDETRVILLQIDDADSTMDSDILSVRFLSETIGMLLQEALSGKYHVVLPMSNNQIAIVLEYESKESELPEKLRDALHETLAVSVSVSESDRYGSSGKTTSMLYLQALHRMRYRVLYGPGMIMTDRREALLKEGAFPEKVKNRALDCVKSGDRQAAHAAAEELIHEAALYTYDAGISQLSAVCYAAASLIQRPNHAEMSYPQIYRTLVMCKDRRELLKAIQLNFEHTMGEMDSARQLQGSTIMLQVLEYIGKNYMKPELSVQMLAEQFGISVSHFSHEFRELTGTTFPAYVNRIRLEQACALLQSKHTVNVSQIAQEVGFYNSSYFSAAFRKQYGVSPLKVHMYGICVAQTGRSNEMEENL